jgi:hypothetical protein
MNYEHIVSGWLGGVAHASDRLRRERSEHERQDREPVTEAAERPVRFGAASALSHRPAD